MLPSERISARTLSLGKTLLSCALAQPRARHLALVAFCNEFEGERCIERKFFPRNHFFTFYLFGENMCSSRVTVSGIVSVARAGAP